MWEAPVLGLVEFHPDGVTPWLGWMLRRSAWGQGVMSGALSAVVEQLVNTEGVEAVEAWADATNVRSIAVARNAGLSERGRFAMRADGGEIREKVVLGRLRDGGSVGAYAAEVVLPVRDVEATLALLAAALGPLGARAGFRVGDPARWARVLFGPWTSGPALRLSAVDEPQPIAAVTVTIEVRGPLEPIHVAATAAGCATDGPPREQPWGGVTFACVLPDGHRLEISAPS